MRGSIPTTEGGTWLKYQADSGDTSSVSTRVTASAMPSRQTHSIRVSLWSLAIVIALNGSTGAALQLAAAIGCGRHVVREVGGGRVRDLEREPLGEAERAKPHACDLERRLPDLEHVAHGIHAIRQLARHVVERRRVDTGPAASRATSSW